MVVNAPEGSRKGLIVKQPSKPWYVVGLALIAVGVGIAYRACTEMIDDVQAMQRVLMPGKAPIDLPAGSSTLYFEQGSVVGGAVYEVAGDISFECAVVDAEFNKLAIDKPTVHETYGFYGYSGSSFADVVAPAAGRYTLLCDGREKFVMAIGGEVSVAGGVVMVLVGVAVGIFGLVIILVVWHRGRWASGPAMFVRSAPPGGDGSDATSPAAPQRVDRGASDP